MVYTTRMIRTEAPEQHEMGPIVETSDALYERYLQNENLTPGQYAKILHQIDDEGQVEALRVHIAAEQAKFWNRWGSWRGRHPDHWLPGFHSIQTLLPTYPQLADFINPQEGDLIIDYMSGYAPVAEHVMARTNGIAGYIGIDGYEPVVRTARTHLASLGIQNTGAYEHNFYDGSLPDGLEEQVASVSPRRLINFSNWGLSYLDMNTLETVLTAGFDMGEDLGVETTFVINMLTDGKFDRSKLAQRFKEEIVPENRQRGNWSGLVRAGIALPSMKQFGKEIEQTGVLAIWTPGEYEELLGERGFQIIERDDSVLWGQSTALRIVRDSNA